MMFPENYFYSIFFSFDHSFDNVNKLYIFQEEAMKAFVEPETLSGNNQVWFIIYIRCMKYNFD